MADSLPGLSSPCLDAVKPFDFRPARMAAQVERQRAYQPRHCPRQASLACYQFELTVVF